MAKNWREVRAEAIRTGKITEAGVAKAAKTNRDAERAYRLTEVRRRVGAVQTEMAATLGVSQAAVSRLEHGDLANTQVGTLDSYVAALGGRLRVIAEFEDESLTLT